MSEGATVRRLLYVEDNEDNLYMLQLWFDVLGGQVERGDDDDRDGPPGGVRLQRRHQLEAVHLGHHQIEQDHVGQFGGDRVEGEPAIRCLANRPASRSEDRSHELTLILVIFDDEDAARRARDPQLRHDFDQALAVDRLG